MASFGHVAIGLLAGRLHGGSPGSPKRRCSGWTLWTFAALALLPDADVILVALGTHDAGPIGHRGASHSFSLALLVGFLAALVARKLGWPVRRTAIAGTLTVASHALLDALGHGGRGLPLFWPLSQGRFHSPWRIFPDAPRGSMLLSRAGLANIAIELGLFLPVIVYALWPALSGRLWPWRRRRPALTMLSGDPAASLAPVPVPARASVPNDRDPPLRSSG